MYQRRSRCAAPSLRPTSPTRVNVALASNGGVATASSTYASSHAPSSVINGDRKGAPWGAGGGWNDATPTFPDWLRIDFAGAKTINEIDVFSVQDNVMAPIEPTAALTFSHYGLTDFQVEYWTGSAWTPIPAGASPAISSYGSKLLFTPVTTTAIRVYITGSSGRLEPPDGSRRCTAAIPPVRSHPNGTDRISERQLVESRHLKCPG